MKDKIREIVEGSSWYEEGEWGVRDAIRDTLVNAIHQATRLDSEKVEKLVYSTIGVDRKTMKFSKDICSQQDELTKKE